MDEEVGKSTGEDESIDVSSRARMMSRRIKVMTKGVRYSEAGNDEEQRKASASRSKALRNRIEQFNKASEGNTSGGVPQGKIRVRRTIKKSTRNNHAAASELRRKYMESVDDNHPNNSDDKEAKRIHDVQQSSHKRESVRNIRTSLSTRRKVFIKAQENTKKKSQRTRHCQRIGVNVLSTPGDETNAEARKLDHADHLEAIAEEQTETKKIPQRRSRKIRASGVERLNHKSANSKILKSGEKAPDQKDNESDAENKIPQAIPTAAPRRLRMSKIVKFQTSSGSGKTSVRRLVRASARHNTGIAERMKNIQLATKSSPQPDDEQSQKGEPSEQKSNKPNRLRFREKYLREFQSEGVKHLGDAETANTKGPKPSQRVIRASCRNISPITKRSDLLKEAMQPKTDQLMEIKKKRIEEAEKEIERVALPLPERDEESDSNGSLEEGGEGSNLTPSERSYESTDISDCDTEDGDDIWIVETYYIERAGNNSHIRENNQSTTNKKERNEGAKDQSEVKTSNEVLENNSGNNQEEKDENTKLTPDVDISGSRENASAADLPEEESVNIPDAKHVTDKKITNDGVVLLKREDGEGNLKSESNVSENMESRLIQPSQDEAKARINKNKDGKVTIQINSEPSEEIDDRDEDESDDDIDEYFFIGDSDEELIDMLDSTDGEDLIFDGDSIDDDDELLFLDEDGNYFDEDGNPFEYFLQISDEDYEEDSGKYLH